MVTFLLLSFAMGALMFGLGWYQLRMEAITRLKQNPMHYFCWTPAHWRETFRGSRLGVGCVVVGFPLALGSLVTLIAHSR